ncbi:MAG: hypothetical protein EXS35_18845 [Pedosphaera sp.]|nr:hypothetical protein [Pedosphaera sp.]
MSATLQRDQACILARRDARKAFEKARSIPDPWFRAQALASVARYIEDDPVKIAKQAAKAADECDDEYKRTAVRAWEIAALAERKHLSEAKKSLREAVSRSKNVTPFSSRAEALTLLLQAAFRIGEKDARLVADELKKSCGQDSHWRCKRAIRDADKFFDGQLQPRPFF